MHPYISYNPGACFTMFWSCLMHITSWRFFGLVLLGLYVISTRNASSIFWLCYLDHSLCDDICLLFDFNEETLILSAWVGSRRRNTLWYGCFLPNSHSCSKDSWDGWDTYAQQGISLLWNLRGERIFVTCVCICAYLSSSFV